MQEGDQLSTHGRVADTATQDQTTASQAIMSDNPRQAE